MKLLLLCLLFAPIVYLAFRQKKWYLYLMVAFVGILPEQLSFKLHDSLPLLTASRVLILLVAAIWLYERIKTRRLNIPISLLVFFGVSIVLSVIHLFTDLDEIKHIAILLMERALVVIMLADMITTREELDRAIDFTILSCCALSVIGIIQTVFAYDITSAMHLTETMSSIILKPRMGLPRAFGTFNAISFACYLSLMLLPIYYRLEKTRLHRYSVAFALAFTALICTFTRSAWLCVVGIFFVLFLLRRLKMVKRLIPAAGMAILLCVVLCVPQPKLARAFTETGKSVINTVLAVLPSGGGSSGGGDSSLGEDEQPDEEDEEPPLDMDEEFGPNATDPTYTRVVQWTAVDYMIGEGKLLLGYGYNAFPEGKLHYQFDRWTTEWLTATTLDVGLVAIITESGLLGLLAQLGLLAFMFIYAWRNKSKNGSFDFYRVILYSIPLYLLLNYLASFPYAAMLWVLWGLFYAQCRLDKTLPSEEEPTLPQKKWQF